MSKTKYYSLRNILEYNAQYNIIFGERSNGKTYAVQEYALKRYIECGEQLAIIRRWEEDFKNNGSKTVDALVSNGNNENMVAKYSNGKYNHIYYYAHKWYLAYYEDGKKIIQDDKPFAYAFSISSEEHYKSTSYPYIVNILFDEFITRNAYLPDEFVKFTSILSTIIRDRGNVKIFMCGNSVNKYGCPYFMEMGLTNIRNMEKGKIDIYTYGDTDLRVAVEFSDSPNKKKNSDKYFAFNNPKLKMITSGTWEMDIYPHLPIKYKPKDIKYTYFIKYDEVILQCEIIKINKSMFTFIHRKTSPIKENETNIIYQQDYDIRKNYKRKITKPESIIETKIADFFKYDRVYYQNNEIGEIVRNYLIWCRNN